MASITEKSANQAPADSRQPGKQILGEKREGPTQRHQDYWTRTGKQLMAGAFSGWCDAAITYPTEYIKVTIQLQEKVKEKRFNGPGDVVRHTFRHYGLLGFYRGFSVVFVGNVPKYMCRFGSYEQIKQLFVDSYGHLAPLDKMLCGLGAGVVEALFAVVPQDSIKVKFINDRCSDNPKYRGLFHGVGCIIRERGLGAMYTGVTPTVLKQSSNQAIRFFVFESLKDWSNRDGDGTGHKALIPLFGIMAGGASVLCNTPLDVIKTRLQGLEGTKYKGTLDCIKQMYLREGFLSFYSGVSMRLLKVCMECCIAFTMYSTFLDLFNVSK